MRRILYLAAVALFVSCGPTYTGPGTDDHTPGRLESALTGTNGRPANGRPVNGRPVNGRFANGRPANGFVWDMKLNGALVGDGSRDATFDTWFNADPTGSNLAMLYIFKCAAPPTVTVTYTATTAVTYTWPGFLNLAPRWASTAPIANDATLVNEQERVSACLLGLTNETGSHVTISARGMGIGIDPGEDTSYPIPEGGFFGNLFAPTPVAYSCFEGPRGSCWDSNSSCPYSPWRSCAKYPSECLMVGAGTCDGCNGDTEDGFSNCVAGGRAWANVFTTRVVQFCGDGICEATESSRTCSRDCGTGGTGGGIAQMQ